MNQQISIRFNIFLFLFLVGTVTYAAPTPERTKVDTNREVIRTYAEVYLETKNYSLAESTITQYLATDQRDGGLYNLLALTQLAQKKYADACSNFKRSADLFGKGEDQANALYGYADCLNQSGKSNESRAVLKVMAESKSPARNHADAVLEQMKSGDIKPGQAFPPFVYRTPGRFTVSGAFSVGYDTNVLLIDDLTATTTAISGKGSVSVSPALLLGYWGTLLNQRFDAQLTTSFTDYLSEQAKSYNLLSERVDFLLGPPQLRLGMFQEMSFINRDPFQLFYFNAGLLARRRIRTNEKQEWVFDLPVKYRYYYFDRNAAAENRRYGVSVSPKAMYLRVFDPDIRFMTSATLNTDYTTGKNFRMTEIVWPTTVMLGVPFLRDYNIINSFGAELGAQWYWQSETKRKDWSAKLNAGLLRPMLKDMRLGLDYSYQKNFSNILTNRYSKHTVLLTASYDLL